MKLSASPAAKKALPDKVLKKLATVLTMADKWLIGSLFAASLAGITCQLLWPTTEQQIVEVRHNGQLIQSSVLKEGYYREIVFKNEAYYNVIEIRDRRVRMKESDCPDQDCVYMGWLDRPPRQIVCLPNLLSISIISPAASVIDDIVR